MAPRMDEHGSAKWMQAKDLEAAKLFGCDGITLGYAKDTGGHMRPVRYADDKHLATFAPNRTGKGTSAIIPALLTYKGAILTTDPKGENAIITAPKRRAMGQNVQILDPWKIALPILNERLSKPFTAGGFNPLDMIDPNGSDLVDDCRMIADTLVMETGGDSHWSDESKSLLATFIGDVLTNPDEAGERHLPRVRDLLGQAPADVQQRIIAMSESPVPFVARGANQLMQKTEKELQSILSTANSNTHFLDSPALRSCLESSSFDFADLKSNDKPLTVYLVIPAERLHTHGRWLRAVVSMALNSITRTRGKPRNSALFILDEFAALGRLSMVEQAFGLMAGYGLRCWAILQDMSQLQDLYPKRWQTFIANAGAVQVFGVSDLATAEYFSRKMGKETRETVSQATIDKRQGTDGLFSQPNPNYRSMNDRSFGRDLMSPDEIMTLDDKWELVFLSAKPPLLAGKLPYYLNSRFRWPKKDGQAGWSASYLHHPDQPASVKPPHTWHKPEDLVDPDEREATKPEKEDDRRPTPAAWMYVLFVLGIIGLFVYAA